MAKTPLPEWICVPASRALIRLSPTGGNVRYFGNTCRAEPISRLGRVSCQLQRLQIFDQIVNLLITEAETEETVVVLYHFAQR